MTPIGVSRALVLVTLGIMLLCGCGPGFGESARLSSLDPATTSIEYRFTDSSVPPEYHRSYSLIATADEANLVVDSYGDILSDETAPIDDATWRALVRAAAGLQIPPSGLADDCVGGTFRELLISEGKDPVLDVQVPVCGDEGQAHADAIQGFMAPLLDLFDLETLLAPSD